MKKETCLFHKRHSPRCCECRNAEHSRKKEERTRHAQWRVEFAKTFHAAQLTRGYSDHRAIAKRSVVHANALIAALEEEGWGQL
jgi:hypothetical protein